jgi:non-homologous end joining protein Ku
LFDWIFSFVQLDDQDGAHGIDYRVVSARPHFHDTNHLLLKQALLDADLVKTSVFVTPHRQLSLRLRKAGAAMVINPLTWMDYVISAHGQSGDVDLFNFMQVLSKCPL